MEGAHGHRYLPETLNELTDIVSREYSDVPNTNRQRPEFPSSPISADQASTEISYRTVKDTPQLRIEFPLPDLKSKWQTKVSSSIRKGERARVLKTVFDRYSLVNTCLTLLDTKEKGPY